ncbi:MAG TPA: hypothetical protein VFA81_11830 [Burkholderiales bacterium]|nr:hypothetical protein [Burkholderiales bacterium]
MTSTQRGPRASRLEIDGNEDAVDHAYYDRGWSDGLPIVAPTPDRVQRMLDASGREPDDVVGLIPPRWGIATVETIAVNAVMAGCLPEYFPIVLAVIDAVSDADFNLHGIQATTHPVSPMIVVNGPIVERIKLNGGSGVFGPGWRANATIGRALRLVLMNVGGGTPGSMDRAAQGHPGKYTLCIAENEPQNPWEPLHVQRGFAASENVVTLFGAASIINACDHTSQSATSMVNLLGGAMANTGLTQPFFGGPVAMVLCPEHAEFLAGAGYTKRDVQEALFERATLPRAAMDASPQWLRLTQRHRPDQFEDLSKDFRVLEKPEDLWIIVAGGVGPHSSFVPNWSDAVQPVSRLVAACPHA